MSVQMLATFTFSGILIWCYVDFQLFKLPVSFICIIKETFILLFVFVYVCGGACTCFSMEISATNSLELQLHLCCELPGVDAGNKTRV